MEHLFFQVGSLYASVGVAAAGATLDYLLGGGHLAALACSGCLLVFSFGLIGASNT